MNESPKYAAMAARIAKAQTVDQCRKLANSLVNAFEFGILTPDELGELDAQLVDKQISLECRQCCNADPLPGGEYCAKCLELPIVKNRAAS